MSTITSDTLCRRLVSLVEPQLTETVLTCEGLLAVDDSISYQHSSLHGGYVQLCDMSDIVLHEYRAEPDNVHCTRGGAMPLPATCAKVVIGPHVRLCKLMYVTVGAIIAEATSLDKLYGVLRDCSFDDGDVDQQQIVNMYLEQHGGGSSEYRIGHGLRVDDSVVSVDSVDDFNGDNTLPATAKLVQTVVGNIDVLLSLI